MIALLYLLDWMCQSSVFNCVKIFTESFFFFAMAAWIHNSCVSMLSPGLHG